MTEAVAETQSQETPADTVNYGNSAAPKEVHTPQGFTQPSQDLATSKDRNFKSRNARLRALMSELGDEEDSRTSEKIKSQLNKGKSDEEAPSETTADHSVEGESTSDDTGSVAGYEPEDNEARKEKRRAEVEASEKAKLKDGEELAAADDADPAKEDGKPEDVSKQEKERRDKFQKVLKMEASNQKKERDLRNLEARLTERERELSNAVNRERQKMDSQFKQYENQVRMAENVLKLARDNPLELLDRAGVKPEELSAWVEAAADPNAQRIKNLERMIAERDREAAETRKEEQRRLNERAQQDQLRAVEQQYLSVFDETESGEPVFEAALMTYSKRELVSMGHDLANEATQRGLSFTHRDIAEAVNEIAKDDPRYKKIQERLSKVAPKTGPSTAQEKVQPAAAAVKSPVQAAKPKPTTIITNTVAQQPSSPAQKKPDPNYKRKREERNKRIFAGLDE